MFKPTTAIALILSTVFAANAHAIGRSGTSADYGQLLADNAGGRAIAVDDGTRHIDVTNGETVRITAGGKSFSWHVDTFPNVSEFDLSRVAPGGAIASGVRVYVAPNPLYFGN